MTALPGRIADLLPATVRWRLTLAFATVIAGIAVFVSLYFPARFERQATRALETRAQAVATVIAFSVRSAVVFDDRQTLAESLRGAMQDPDVQRVEVLSVGGAPLSALGRPGAGGGAGEVLRVEVPVRFHDEVIATTRVTMSLARVRATTAAMGRLVGGVSLLIFGLGTLAIFAFSRLVTASLSRIVATADHIAGGALGERADATLRGEAGQLARSFNTMVDRLQEMQDDLHQAQKMEAVGRLAGGIAHDFNNLLTVVIGNLELVLQTDAYPQELRAHLAEVYQAAGRAASLTQQLLAFSRRQIVQPRVLDLNDVVRDASGILQRVLGENVRLGTRLALEPATVHIDPAQLDQIVLNLALNARDAMPQGGDLWIGVRVLGRGQLPPEQLPAGPGAHRLVELEVRDTGVGMSEEVLGQIFEPFFTTKEQGKGTGLGLSSVYGIVSGSGGSIQVESRPGGGSTFRIRFPRVAPVEAPARPLEHRAAPAGGRETLLIAEDEPMLLKLAAAALERRGYTVLTAPDGQRALDLARAHEGPIDLLLTDVVMPGLNGRELWEALSRSRSETRVLFMSGYNDDDILRLGVQEADVPFIGKPFELCDLYERVRGLLDPAPRAGPAAEATPAA